MSRARARLIPAGLFLAAMAMALAQRTGHAAADTKIDLHVDPVGFLGDVASVWSSSGGLGQVQAGQYAGYLFPMGPFFALLHSAGMAPWLVDRLWIGAVLGLGAWGVVRLLDALVERPRGATHVAAGVLFLLNPYVVVFANRTSFTFLAYATLPWLLLCVHRGLREPRGWWWPAAFALLVACTGGGVNAAVTAWVLVGPIALVAFEAYTGGVSRGDVLRFAARVGGLSVLANLWWLVPVAEHARYGLNFLPFTETAGAIWTTTSLSESFRGMGYWISYLGTGFGSRPTAYFDTSDTMLFNSAVVAATFVVPATAIAGYAWTRRNRYATFFLLLALLGTFIVATGFPEGVPFRRGLTFVYNHAEPVQFLRTTYKASALLMLSVAALGGMAAGHAWDRLRTPRRRAVVAATALVVVAASAWPLVSGRAIDAQVVYGSVPSAWQSTAADVDAGVRNGRALVLPGQLFPFYRWGGTQDPILPAITKRPVAIRTSVPYSDLHGADLLLTTDSLIQQRRVLPGQLAPLAELMGARAVVTATDDDRDRSGALDPAASAGQLAEGGLGASGPAHGAARSFAPPPGEIGARARLPEVRSVALPRARGMVRIEPRAPETVVDGSAEGLAGLAALGALPGGRPLSYAGDRSTRRLREAAAAGADLVVTDTNRRRVVVSSRARQTVGATLGAEDPLSADAAELNPFDRRGTAGQTVAVYDGARYVRAPFSPNFPQFPEHRPYAAFDGDPGTYWAADRALEDPDHWIEIGFDQPRAVPYVDVLPQREGGALVTSVSAGGRTFPVRPGWNRLRLGLRGAASLRIEIAGVNGPRDGGEGALAEVRVPGLSVRELKRPPTLLTSALAGVALEHSSLSYVLARESGDDPFRRAVEPDARLAYRPPEEDEAARVAQPGDAETGLRRVLNLPAGRAFALDGLASVAPGAPDDRLDRLAGTLGSARFTSSSRLYGRPAYRASRAFDGSPATAWIAPDRRGASISWRTRRPQTLSTFTVEGPTQRVSTPTAVRVSWAGGHTGALAISPAGSVELPRPVRARSFTVSVARVLRPRRGPGTAPRAVGIGEIAVPGLSRPPAPRDGRLPAVCPITVRVGGAQRRVGLRDTRARFEAGRPLRVRGCGAPLRLGPGRHELSASVRLFRPELLRLRSPAPSPRAAPAVSAGSVTDAGHAGHGRYDGVRLGVTGAAWLVLGESYNRGWRAWCGKRSLGEPEVIDGYANGWRVGRGCTTARFAFAANSAARVSYWISGVGVLVLLVLLVAGGLARRRRRPGAPAPVSAAALRLADRPRGISGRAAIVTAVALAAVCGFLFALRAGVVAGPALAFLLWRGVGARSLVLAAAAILGLVLPLVYLAFGPSDRGGFNTDYAQDLLGAHWLAVAAWLLLALAAALTVRRISRASGPSDDRAGESAGPAAPPTAP